MPFTVNVPTGFTERSIIVSGGIKRPGFPNCGVIYTTSVHPSASDFDTALLPHCKILGPNGREFSIVGGYYMERTGTTVTTTQCFGVALDASQGFEIAEGGQKTIGDSWNHLDPRFNQFNLNEREEDAEPSGWTFIVREALADRDGYPLSGQPVAMVAPCPAIASLEVDVVAEDHETLTVKFTAGLSEDSFPPMAYKWILGDGVEHVLASPTCNHMYKKGSEARTVQASVEGVSPSSCGGSAHAETSVEVASRACSQLLKIDTKIHQEHADELEVQFTAMVADAEAERYLWDFGDGQRGEGKMVRHLYKKAPTENGKVFRVTVTTKGPDPCTSQSVRQMVPWPPSGA